MAEPDIVERLRWGTHCDTFSPAFTRAMLAEAAAEIERLRGRISEEALAKALYDGGMAVLLGAEHGHRRPWHEAPARLRTDYKRHARHVLRLLPGGEPPT
jgi:hypothetical protein